MEPAAESLAPQDPAPAHSHPLPTLAQNLVQEPAVIDVHPPHTALHGWRDFFIHIATITIGLLIAIGLEQSVEWMHHRHLVREARENIRQEIETNQKQVAVNLQRVDDDLKSMKGNLAMARPLRTNPHALDHGSMQFNFAWNSFDQSAWRSARDTGALTYMPTAEVQAYDDAYAQQDIVDKEAVAIFTHQSEVAAPLFMNKDTETMPPADVEELLHGIAVSGLQLNILEQLIQTLGTSYTTALQKTAHL